MSALRAIEMFGQSEGEDDHAEDVDFDLGEDFDVTDVFGEEFDLELDRQLEELLQLEIVGIRAS